MIFQIDEILRRRLVVWRWDCKGGGGRVGSNHRNAWRETPASVTEKKQLTHENYI